MIAYVRSDGNETVLVAHNLSAAAVSDTLTVATTATAADALFADGDATLGVSGSTWSLSLPARGSGAWRLH